ncbi:TRAP transporter large permease [Acuticoccus sp. M5D2P5]|uniref:TRAP transporter large permease n=1 Tax=Acuticoccus kalidii TaxID=2910977 RepID=UPI001F25566B|nr:TRAP transporter large permease [Acuticoccus kalidii]MCF3933267.1 TRAP transporter large permease [Acuticoccus kalidii]
MTVAVTFSALIGLILLGAPIAITLLISTSAGLVFTTELPVAVVVQRMYTGIDSFTLIAIPLFILTGRMMALGGITNELLELSRSLVGFMRGGLAYVNVVSSMFFAGITGSATADTSSVGAVLIPAMQKRGYDTGFSVAVTAASSTIGIIIPPSIPLVIYAVVSGTSVGRLFLAGVIPGFMIGFALLLVCGILARRRGYPVEGTFSLKRAVKATIRGIPPLTTIVIIVGGITFGVFTPTEAAGVAAAYSFLLGTIYYRELKLSMMPRIMLEVSLVTAAVSLMIATASGLGWLLAAEQVPREIGGWITQISSNPIVVLLLMNLVFLFVGTWLDLTPALIIFTPIFLPIATALGIDPVHFGLIAVVNLGIGLFTPPVGLCLFVACSIAKIPIGKAIVPTLPFFLAMLVVLLLITLVPALVLTLPNAIMG